MLGPIKWWVPTSCWSNSFWFPIFFFCGFRGGGSEGGVRSGFWVGIGRGERKEGVKRVCDV